MGFLILYNLVNLKDFKEPIFVSVLLVLNQINNVVVLHQLDFLMMLLLNLAVLNLELVSSVVLNNVVLMVQLSLLVIAVKLLFEVKVKESEKSYIINFVLSVLVSVCIV